MRKTIISLPPKTILGYRKNGNPIFNIAGGSEPFGSGEGGGDGNTGGEGQSQGNPAWNEFLEVVPQELHPQVTPILSKWDQGVQQRFQQVHSEYEPWKPVIGSGYNPEDVQFALNMLNALQSNPRDVYDKLGEYYKFSAATGQSEQGQGEPQTEEEPWRQELAAIQQQNRMMAEYLQAQQQEQLSQQADAQLDAELAAAAKKYGQFDEQFVVAKMMGGMSAEEAAQSYHAWREQEMQRHVPKPLILGGGSSVPNQGIDPRKLNDGQTKNLVVEMLKAAQQQQ